MCITILNYLMAYITENEKNNIKTNNIKTHIILNNYGIIGCKCVKGRLTAFFNMWIHRIEVEVASKLVYTIFLLNLPKFNDQHCSLHISK